ncbi:XrtA/PEP-CTERM system amidotransferase [Vibrio porteresiae]|uniref:asparagine synthase (glutamine-hydrolyzing) n=1 Tax=Vibrio porteresiae DSM 19223 TaxID=1123496 RepID=A0ABZ0QBE4_9VIBR|nr:XrtA/PEP-CTERM system amidotransferase [Vibrio porteresiae]WPC72871.1 amidotransferase 1, exosortase A system-associated [Vibrio porteresiae DSM 19223]
MCGISGIFNIHQAPPVDKALLQSINRLQSHRGPDDEGYFFDRNIGLAHRRLSIIDLSGGHQPVFNETHSVCVVFNGEIYNFKSLVAELVNFGHQFATLSDTEVIVHAWEQWGVDCLSRFQGMFCFALWDQMSQQLFIARDRLGKKPLYYAQTERGQFIFGSELKVLVGHPDVDKTLRHELAEEFLMFGYLPDPYTAYQNIFKLEPAHYLLLSPGSAVRPVEYWDLPTPETIQTWDETQQSLIDHLKAAVNIRMMADVPLGAFLSGGVDSSAVVAMMAHYQNEPINTCAIGFNESQYDESDYAAQIATRYGTHHTLKVVSGDEYDLIDKLTDIYDEPFADSSALPTYRVCELARQSVKVALTGDGGDEVFAGYRRYRLQLAEQQLRGSLPYAVRKPIFGLLGKVYPKADWAPQFLRAKTTFQSLAMNPIEAYGNTMSRLRHDQRKALFSAQYNKSLNGYSGLEIIKHHAQKSPTDDPLKRIQYLDIKTWLAGDILTKIDRASMANSLETRAPLLDHKLIEWAYSIANSSNIHGNQGKYAFKKALEPYVDDNILYRPKMGFSIPIAQWFRGPLQEKLHHTVLSERMFDSGYFKPEALKQLVSSHISGRSDHSDALWCLLMFGQFLNRQA